MQELQGYSYDSEFYLCREMGSMGFPVTNICTLQEASVTQGNVAIFKGNKFAVYQNYLQEKYYVGRQGKMGSNFVLHI